MAPEEKKQTLEPLEGRESEHSEPAAAPGEGAACSPERDPVQQTLEELAAADLETIHPADAADHLSRLPIKDQAAWVEKLPVPVAAEALEEMEQHQRAPLLEQLDTPLAAKLLSEMSPDDAADALDELKEEYRNALLKRLKHADATLLRKLMRFDPDSAGGVMTTECLVLDHRLSADQAIAIIRKEIVDKEIPYYAYLLDENDHLVGVLSLRDILLGKPGVMLKDLLQERTLIAVHFDVDKEEVAHQIRHYNFLAMPVIDYDGKFLGVVTHDDIMDIIHEEASEDMLGMVGAGQDETVDTPWKSSVLKRLPWLCINMVNSGFSAYVVHFFEGTITEMAILAALMPIVANQAGNTGQQSLAVIIRQLAMERFDRKRISYAILREARLGLANGLIIATLVFLLALLVTHKLELAQVLALALGVNMFLGAVAGASIPLILRALGRDPAQASSIFLTTITDSAGFFIFLGLASVMLLR